MFCNICRTVINRAFYLTISLVKGVLTQAITMVVSSAPHGANFRILDNILMKKKMSWIMVTTIWSIVTIGPRSMMGRLQLVAVIRLTTVELLATR